MTAAGAASGGTDGTGRQLAILYLITFINLVGFGIVLPVFPFFGTLVGATPGETTLAMAAYSLGQFVGAPLWGKLSDRYGRRPVLVASLIGAILSYLIMANATDIWTLGGSRLFGGLMAGNIAAALAYVGDITTPAERPKAMGMIGAAFGLGFIFGPAIGGLIAGAGADYGDFAGIGYASAGFALIAVIGTLLFLPESLTADRRQRARTDQPAVPLGDVLRAKPVVAGLMLLALVVISGAALMETTLAFFAHDVIGWGPRTVGFSFAAVGIISAALQGGAAGPLNRRFGSGPLVIAGVAGHMIGLAIMAVAHSALVLIIGLAVLAVGLGLFNPAFQTLASDQSDDQDRGLVMGLTQGASSLGRVIGPAVSGSIYAGVGRHAPFAIGAAVMLIALVAAVMVTIRGRHTTEAKGAAA